MATTFEGSTANRAVIFFDIDGTLLVPGRDFLKEQREREKLIAAARERGEEPPAVPAPAARKPIEPRPAVVEAFAKLHEQGHLAFISTGRPKAFLQQALLDLEPDGFICLAGAYVEARGEVLRQVTIPAGLLERVATMMSSAGLDVDYEAAGEGASLYPEHDAVLRNRPLVRTVPELVGIAESLGGFSKFVLRGDQSANLAPVLPELLEHFDTADMGQGIREFTLKGMNKRSGIELVLEHLGHGRQNTYAFGDSENDLPMADAVETFVAMGNAFDVVKEHAGYVTDSVFEDGVATGLAHFGLLG